MKTAKEIINDASNKRITQAQKQVYLMLINSFSPETLERNFAQAEVKKTILKQQAEMVATNERGHFNNVLYVKELERLGYPRVNKTYNELKYIFDK